MIFEWFFFFLVFNRHSFWQNKSNSKVRAIREISISEFRIFSYHARWANAGKEQSVRSEYGVVKDYVWTVFPGWVRLGQVSSGRFKSRTKSPVIFINTCFIVNLEGRRFFTGVLSSGLQSALVRVLLRSRIRGRRDKSKNRDYRDI